MFRKDQNLFFLLFLYCRKTIKKRILRYIMVEKETIGSITYWKKYKKLGYIILPNYKKPNKVTRENYFNMTDIHWSKEDVLYRVSYKELPTKYKEKINK